jgi:hypothetical protein
LRPSEENFDRYFTDFDGRFKGRLSAVIPVKVAESPHPGISARYACIVKVEYDKDLMRFVEEGMLLAVRNFKASKASDRYTLMVISRVWPEHYGLRGMSDFSYFPMQFEIIEQSVKDWDSDDKSTMMVQISAIPINYDMQIEEDRTCYVKGFSYPMVAEEARILNGDVIKQMYNQRVMEEMGLELEGTFQDARRDPRLGVIRMFESSVERIPIYVDFESLVRYHFGVFAFTGGGKSNLLSNVLRRILLHSNEVKVVVFDVSCEYPFLLMDLLADEAISSKIILEAPVQNVDQLYNSIVKPREYEEDERVVRGFEGVLSQGRVSYYRPPRLIIPSYSHILNELDTLRKDNLDKPHYVNAIDRVKTSILDYMDQGNVLEGTEIGHEFVDYLDQVAQKAVEDYSVHEKSGLYAWATTRHQLRDLFREKKTQGLTTEEIRNLIEKTDLTCLSISEPATIKELVINLSRDFLRMRKRRFQVKPYILFVFDEAQEFIPDANATGIDRKCSKAVETLLRQGRKYGLGGCIATQRIAYLNTNALQQLHTYFVGTLPRPYDRGLVSETFTIDKGILEKTLEFAPGEWLLSSYIATGMENVPIFIKADNAEIEIEAFLNSI